MELASQTMRKLDINLDAYRLIAETLGRLRQLIREKLQAEFGSEWEAEGIAPEVAEILRQRQTREVGINWHFSDTSDALDFAGFANLFDIIADNETLLRLFTAIAPDKNVLNIRFQELDIVLNRVAYARPVSEGEMGFLVSFDERLRKLVGAAAEAEPPRKGASREKAKAAESPAKPAAEPAAKPPVESGGRAATKEKGAPLTSAAGASPPPASKAQEPPARAAARPETSRQQLARALDNGDDTVILTAIYREISSVAEGLWAQPSTDRPWVWELVRESSWYQNKFLTLGLRVVSDFYALAEEAHEKLRTGASRAQMQEFLNGRNFAELLLSLREFFRHRIAPAAPKGATN